MTRMHIAIAQIGKNGRGVIARLFGEFREINTAAIKARRRAGFKPPDGKLEFA